MRFLFTSFLATLAVLTHAQGERNIWYFGTNAGLDFNSGTPVPLTDGQLVTSEGCASIANMLGELLFYTDGISVWDRNHQVMPNGTGLMGGVSSTQSGVIVPKPGSSTIYYVFTVGQEADPNGMRYSEVDMTLNNGNGDVTLVKNVPLAAPTCEKIAAVQHANGTDYWVLSHRFDSDVFIAFHVSAAGIDNVPVESTAGVFVGGMTQNSIGQLRVSPDGTRLAAAHWFMNVMQVFDLDNSTGLVSNPIDLTGFEESGPYGVEFSPNGRYLYIGEANAFTSHVYQFDLLAGTEAQIDASQVTLHTFQGIGGELQLGPDLRIYFAWYQANALDVIMQPDLPGAACQFTVGAQPLNGGTSQLGLPTFIDSHTSFQISAWGFCPGDTTGLMVLPAGQADSIFWDLGDPGSGSLNVSQADSLSHFYSVPGTYPVQAIVFADDEVDTLHLSLEMVAPLTDFLGNDTALCPGGSFLLDLTGLADNYTWQDGSHAPQFAVDGPGVYWLELTTSGCPFSDTIHVEENPVPEPDLGTDVLICTGETAVLSTGIPDGDHYWSDGTTGSTMPVMLPGTYWVQVTVAGCSGSDTVHVGTMPCEPIIEMPNVISPNGNSLNEFWEPLIIQGIAEITTTIYNRWGQEVHVASGPPQWNGRHTNHEPVPDGVYFWILSYTDLRGRELEQHGTVTVLR